MDIRTKVLDAIRWSATARIAAQLVSWAITIFVIRILSPADYGLMAMATVLMSLLYLVHDLGLDAVLVHRKDLGEATRRQVFGIVIVVNLVLFGVLQASAPLVAALFREPELVPLIRVLAVQFCFYMFETLPLARLERELDFRSRAIVDLGALLLGSLVTLLMALAGQGVWALIAGNLLTVATRIFGLNVIAPCLCAPRFSWHAMRDALDYGRAVSLDRVLWFVFSESDRLIGGRMLGAEPLGIYAVSNNVASLPINKTAGMIRSIAFPAFSQLQSEPDAVRSYLLKAVRVMSLAAFPAFFGIAALAPEIVIVLLGEKWLEVVLPLQILAIVMPIRLVGTVLPPVLWGVGRPDVSAMNFVIAAVAMPVAFLIGARYGPVGLAMAWLLAFPVVYLITVVRTVRVLEMSGTALVGAMLWPALAGAAMLAVVTALRQFVAPDLAGVARLLVFGLGGGALYLALIVAFYRAGFDEVRDLLRG